MPVPDKTLVPGTKESAQQAEQAATGPPFAPAAPASPTAPAGVEDSGKAAEDTIAEEVPPPVDFTGLEVTKVEQVKALAMVENTPESLVCVEGVVTWTDAHGEKVFFLQETARKGQERVGIKVAYEADDGPERGDKLKVKGMVTRGDFMPVIAQAEFEVQGKSELPQVLEATGGGLLNGAWDAELIETTGWVRTAEMVDENTMVGVLDTRVGFQLDHVKSYSADKLVGAKLRIKGVANPVKSRAAIRQLAEVQVLVSAEHAVFVWQTEAPPWDSPALELKEVFQYRLGQTRGERLHVRGKVMLVTDGVAWLNDGNSGLALRGKVSDVKTGEQVEAVGFRDVENFLPVLSYAVIHPDEGPPLKVTVKDLPMESLQGGEYHADYVAVTGQLLDRIDTPQGTGARRTVLALQLGRGVVTAELDAPPGAPEIPPLETGCVLRVAGICKVETDLEGEATGFKMLLPDAAAVTVMAEAPFFNVKRLLILLSVALGVLFVAALAAALLARRNVSLMAQMRERRAIAAERSRLARDLHDTLEQGLTGIHLQLHSIGPAQDEASGETQEKLGGIRRLVLQCHSELRRSIWNLRAEALEHFDLGDALQRAAQSLFLGSGTRVEIKQPPGGLDIPALVADNLLRIGQEAMTNALKHARASLLRVELAMEGEKVVLTVSDNGGGLVPASERGARGGHFGLMGMEERAERIGGRLTITGKPGEGTRVRVEVPLAGAGGE